MVQHFTRNCPRISISITIGGLLSIKDGKVARTFLLYYILGKLIKYIPLL